MINYLETPNSIADIMESTIVNKLEPQCFTFCGRSIRIMHLILTSWSLALFGTIMGYHSGVLGDNIVGRNITLPNSLSSNDNSPGFTAYSLIFTTGSG
ncbi:hypothetical protein GZH46_02223, partial [Fragariocoptes setiger]